MFTLHIQYDSQRNVIDNIHNAPDIVTFQYGKHGSVLTSNKSGSKLVESGYICTITEKRCLTAFEYTWRRINAIKFGC